jgi:hypothetical protein
MPINYYAIRQKIKIYGDISRRRQAKVSAFIATMGAETSY